METKDLFWGVVIKPDKRYEQVVQHPVHVTKACLQPTDDDNKGKIVSVVVEKDGNEFIFSNLYQPGNLSDPLNLHFNEGESIVLRTYGSGTVHLTGYIVQDRTATGSNDSGMEDNFTSEEKRIADDSPKYKEKCGNDKKRRRVDTPSIDYKQKFSSKVSSLLAKSQMSGNEPEEVLLDRLQTVLPTGTSITSPKQLKLSRNRSDEKLGDNTEGNEIINEYQRPKDNVLVIDVENDTAMNRISPMRRKKRDIKVSHGKEETSVLIQVSEEQKIVGKVGSDQDTDYLDRLKTALPGETLITSPKQSKSMIKYDTSMQTNDIEILTDTNNSNENNASSTHVKNRDKPISQEKESVLEKEENDGTTSKYFEDKIIDSRKVIADKQNSAKIESSEKETTETTVVDLSPKEVDNVELSELKDSKTKTSDLASILVEDLTELAVEKVEQNSSPKAKVVSPKTKDEKSNESANSVESHTKNNSNKEQPIHQEEKKNKLDKSAASDTDKVATISSLVDKDKIHKKDRQEETDFNDMKRMLGISGNKISTKEADEGDKKESNASNKKSTSIDSKETSRAIDDKHDNENIESLEDKTNNISEKKQNEKDIALKENKNEPDSQSKTPKKKKEKGKHKESNICGIISPLNIPNKLQSMEETIVAETSSQVATKDAKKNENIKQSRSFSPMDTSDTRSSETVNNATEKDFGEEHAKERDGDSDPPKIEKADDMENDDDTDDSDTPEEMETDEIEKVSNKDKASIETRKGGPLINSKKASIKYKKKAKLDEASKEGKEDDKQNQKDPENSSDKENANEVKEEESNHEGSPVSAFQMSKENTSKALKASSEKDKKCDSKNIKYAEEEIKKHKLRVDKDKKVKTGEVDEKRSKRKDKDNKEKKSKVKEVASEPIKSILKSKPNEESENIADNAANTEDAKETVGDTPRPKKDKKVAICDTPRPEKGKKVTIFDTPRPKKETKSDGDDKATEAENKAPEKEAEPKTPKRDRLNQSLPAKTPTKTTKGGVIIKDIREGQGKPAERGKMVGIYYQGKIKNSNKIIGGRKKAEGKPFAFRLGKGEVIKGLDAGIEGMAPGGKRKITIPPKMAKGHPIFASSDVPSNSILVFEVECKYVDKESSRKSMSKAEK